jgi:transposase
VLAFWDESGFLMVPLVQRTWAPCGQTPQLAHRLVHHTRVSAVGILTVSPRRRRLGCYHFLQPRDSIDDTVVVAILRQMRRHFRRPIVLVWDRLSIHRSNSVTDYLQTVPDLQVEHFPAYAPELNPVEALWADAKCHDLAHFCPHDLAELEDTTSTALRSKHDDAARIAGYIRRTKLPLRLPYNDSPLST